MKIQRSWVLPCTAAIVAVITAIAMRRKRAEAKPEETGDLPA